MANIFYEEKRAVKIGEVCAVHLKDIRPIYLSLVDSKENSDIVNFFSHERSGISKDDKITFVKYIGNGLFMDLVSDQLLITETYNCDDFGTDELHAMDKESIDEIVKMETFWNSIQNPKNKVEFSKSLSVFMQNPLVIDIAAVPFISINSEIAIKFASQSLERVREKLISARDMAKHDLEQDYSKYSRRIIEHYYAIEKEARGTK